MFQKEAKKGLQKLEQPVDTSLYLFTSTNLEDCLTPTTLSFFNSAMTEGSEQPFSSFSGLSQDVKGNDDFSDEETGDDSSESFEVRGGVVPTTNSGQGISDQASTRSQGSQKSKSLKRKLPGPRPAFSDDELTEEEMQRRMRRRERNKMAAARCRQRRVDQTNELLHETKNLETEASRLEKEIESLEKLKTKLEIVLQSHIPMCTAQIQEGQGVPSSSGTFQGPPSPPLYLTSNPQSSLVLVTLPSGIGQNATSAGEPSNPPESLTGLPLRPNTLPVLGSSSVLGNAMEMRSDGSLFDFNLPVVSSPLNSTGGTPFSASDFLTPTTLEHRLFD